MPDAAGRGAAGRILELARGLSEADLLICLISGGGSALLALPADGVSLEDKRAVNAALLRSGADDRRDELRAQAPLGGEGRPPGGRRPSRPRRDVPHQRRARRRPLGDRLRSHGARPDDVRGRAGGAGALRHRRARPRRIDHLRRCAARQETPKPATPPSPTTRSSCSPRPPTRWRRRPLAPAPQGLTASSSATTSRARPATLGGRHAALALGCARGGERALIALREAVGARRRPSAPPACSPRRSARSCSCPAARPR